MEQWIEEKLSLYKSIYVKYAESEVAISHCALSMAKILNGLSEMSYTQFHKYEKKMLWSAIELFSEQCIEQIRFALVSKNVIEKKEVISDIEKSISRIMEVCRNIFDGTANAERQMFQSLSVDANLYDLSPKLCAFYASILEQVIVLFAEAGQRYAFVIHPTLRSTIEARILLESRKESGRVVVVYISESVIEEFKLVPICLIHEAFHVITKKERHRQLRAKYFVLHMMLYIEQYLFQGVVLSSDDKQNCRIKQEMMEDSFKDILKLGDLINEEPEDSKWFYSRNLKRDICKKIKDDLISLTGNLEEMVIRRLCEKQGKEPYSSFRQNFSKAKEIINQMQQNLNDIISNNKVLILANHLMHIYRETYADIACILTLNLTPEQYGDAFVRSIQFDYDKENYLDIDKVVREYLVAQAVASVVSSKQKMKWEEYLENTRENLPKNMEKQKGCYGQSNDNYGKIVKMEVTEQSLSLFGTYLLKCAKSLSERLCEMQDVEVFRGFIKRVIMGDSSKLLLDILSQDAESILD